ncbi:hypothetical protein OIV83_004407 [Microbotryomycetes sp. JL201]|nr:hypothetical protein OIV83_004407 [Microbotryomycetes sp. JL201]
MSAPSFSTDSATVQAAASDPQPTQTKPSGAELAQDFKQTFGQHETGSRAGSTEQQVGGQVGGHFNRITKRWERDDEYVVDTTQNASTMPEDEANDSDGPKKGFSLKKLLGK